MSATMVPGLQSIKEPSRLISSAASALARCSKATHVNARQIRVAAGRRFRFMVLWLERRCSLNYTRSGDFTLLADDSARDSLDGVTLCERQRDCRTPKMAGCLAE